MKVLLWLVYCTLSNLKIVSGENDPYCYDNCKCCTDGTCETWFGWDNACSMGCIDGHRGVRCYEFCQYTNCKECGFNTGSKICEVCYDGYYLGPNKDCTLECPSNCKSCTSSTACTECKEGFFDQDGSSTCKYSLCPGNCECNETECISCLKGFYEISSLCSKPCPPNCETCVSNEQCHECKSGFYNGYEHDDSMNIYFKNCTHECRETCTQCQSYNKCLQCVQGKNGLTCEEDCSIGCKDNKCRVDSGTCSCLMNFTGDKCTECVDGNYGNYCNLTCSVFCKGNICDKTSAECTEGCRKEAITGKICNTCKPGMYGDQCDKMCPVNCKDDECERHSGICIYGCADNFNGTLCETCIHGKYGNNCELNCPDKCVQGICDKNSRKCLSCVENFDGDKCNKCIHRFYGTYCNKKCSLQCVNNSCDRDTGVCNYGCTNGFSGDKCCVKSENCMSCSSNTECKQCSSGYFQHLCKAKCPINCLDSCKFSTGECADCQKNYFGQFCNFSCSDKCQISEDSSEKRCVRSDGTCIHGCVDGYFGHKCNNMCSSLCVDQNCRQDTGICVNGCDGQHDDPECAQNLESHGDVVEEKSTVASAVLGSLFAISVVMNIVILFVCVRQRKKSSRSETRGQRLDVIYENQLVSTDVQLSGTRINESQTETSSIPCGISVTENETDPASAKKVTVYEAINRAPGTDSDLEHEYQQISSIPTVAIQQTRH